MLDLVRCVSGFGQIRAVRLDFGRGELFGADHRLATDTGSFLIQKHHSS